MKICIFGGSGFIGTNIALAATKRKHKVIIIDSLARIGSEENLYIANATYIRGDIRNQEDFERLPKNIDAIINLAANSGVPWSYTYPLYDFKINALGALHVLEYARNHGKIPVIFASTNKIYSDKLNEIAIKEKPTRYEWIDKKYIGVPESFPMDGVGTYSHSPYGASKAAADLYHQEYYHAYKIPTVINRMSCLTKDTLIATVDGNRSIESLLSENKDIYVYSLDHNNDGKLKLLKVNKIWKTGTKKTYLIKTTKREIRATADHKFLTKLESNRRYSYRQLSALNKGDKLFSYFFQNSYDIDSSLQIIQINFDPAWKLYHGKSNSSPYYKDRLIQEISKIFIPKNYTALARLLGYLFGDGHLGISYDRTNNKKVFNTCFYGDLPTLENINQELKNIGLKSMPFKKKYSESTISNGHIIKGNSISMRSGSSTIFILFYLLGCPVGDKTIYEGGFPWFVKTNQILKREFLRGFFDAELARLIWQESKKCWGGLSLVITKRRGVKNKLLDEITEYLDKRGITYTPISVKKDLLTTKGITNQYVLNIHKNKTNILRFAEYIGFAYNLNRQKLLCESLGVYEEIESISEFSFEDVYDLEIDQTHNFFANNVNVHNCIYGYYQKGVADQGWIDHFIKTITLGDGKIDVFGDGKQVRDMLWAEDVAKLYLDELERIDKVQGQVFNVGGGMQNTLSLLEAIKIIERYTGKKAKVSFKDWRMADQRVYISDIRKVRKFLGWKPKVSPQEGIKRMIKRLNEHSI